MHLLGVISLKSIAAMLVWGRVMPLNGVRVTLYTTAFERQDLSNGHMVGFNQFAGWSLKCYQCTFTSVDACDNMVLSNQA